MCVCMCVYGSHIQMLILFIDHNQPVVFGEGQDFFL